SRPVLESGRLDGVCRADCCRADPNDFAGRGFLASGTTRAAGYDDTPQGIVTFVSSIADVTAETAGANSPYERGAALWFAYPKKTGTIKTDISRDVGWEPVTQAGLLFVTLVSLDDT